MKKPPFLPFLALAFCLLPPLARAAPVFTTLVHGPFAPSTTTDEVFFAADVSNTDLLHGLTGTHTGWKNANGSRDIYLNDGNAGGDFDAVGLTALTGAAWANNGNVGSSTYELGTAAGLGYDLTGIQSIAAWQGAGFPNQNYNVSVRYAGAVDFTPLLTVAYQPFPATPNNNGGSTKVNVTDSTGLLATGVVAVKFDVRDTVGATSGGTVFREIDVTGNPTPVPDTDSDGMPNTFELAHTTPPSATALNPEDDPENGGAGDGLTNLSEYQSGTDPNNPDTDGDGLQDGPEKAGAGARPATSPIKADTDGDGLNDKSESNTGIFVSATDTGSNPTLADSDADGSKDGMEVTAHKNPNDPLSRLLRIMSIGDSITAGYTDNPGWANHPFRFGYRSGLYSRLSAAGYAFQFVGSSPEPWDGTSGDPTRGGTYTPAFDLRTFDQDHHRGYGGIQIPAVQTSVAAWLATDKPDVILLMIGINGIGPGSPDLLNSLVNTIVTNAPNARLIVAQITPRNVYNADLYNYNVYIRDTLVPTYAGNGAKITTVDLYSLFLTNPADPTEIAPGVLANNINHPNNTLYDAMAGVWFTGIEALGLKFTITGIQFDQTLRSVTLTFNSLPGKTYTVQSATALTVAGQPGGWTNLTTTLASQGAATTYVDTVAAGSGPRVYYRVREN